MRNDINVIMMGMGYIGLPTATLIASKKINVTGVDINESVVATINRGDVHIVEPDLSALVRDVVEKGHLKAELQPSEADVFLVAVPTPFRENNEPDVSYVESAVEMIIPFLKEENLVVIESTCPIGTTERIADLIYSKRPELNEKIYICYCPERVLPGQVFYELQHNDRVIGGLDKKSAEKALDFYSLFVVGNLHETSAKTAEMCKLVENAYRDVNIAFANELSMISDKINVNVWELIELANKHPRVNILEPGPGVGGHCIAIDPWFIISDFKEEAQIIRSAREVNMNKTDWVLSRVRDKMSKFDKSKAVIACMGLSYKPDIDDLRASPALEITERLIAEEYNVMVVEPNLESSDSFELADYEDAVEKADVIILLVKHREFKRLRYKSDKVILDFCGLVKQMKPVD